MKLSALQQSPNLLLDALQQTTSTMVASATSITDPLPQNKFSVTSTIDATDATLINVPSGAAFTVSNTYLFSYSTFVLGFTVDVITGNQLTVTWQTSPAPVSQLGVITQARFATVNAGSSSLIDVASTANYKVGDFLLFYTPPSVTAILIAAILPNDRLFVQWLGAPPATGTPGFIVNGTGSSTNDSYLMTQGEGIVLDAGQVSASIDQFIHIVIRCQATSALSLSTALLGGVYAVNQYNAALSQGGVASFTAIRALSVGEYEAEMIIPFNSYSFLDSSALSNGAVRTVCFFRNAGTDPVYLKDVRVCTRQDAVYLIPQPYEYLVAPNTPVITDAIGGSVAQGLFAISGGLQSLVSDSLTHIKSVEWQLATDNLFSSTSLIAFYQVSSEIGNSNLLLTANMVDFNLIAPPPINGTTLYVRCRVYNEVGIASLWATPVSFTYDNTGKWITASASPDFVNSVINVSLTLNGFATTSNPVPVTVGIEQANSDPTQPPIYISTISDSVLAGQTNLALSLQNVNFYEFDAGVIINVYVLPTSYFDGVEGNMAVYTTPSDNSTLLSQNWTKPLTPYLPYVASYSGDPNINPDTESTNSITGRILFDSSIGDVGWLRNPFTGWKQLSYATLRKKEITGPMITGGVYTLVAEDLGATLVFDSATSVVIDMSNSYSDNLPEGFTFNFRNKQTGALSIQYTHANIQGAGTPGTVIAVANPNKVNSAYIETRGFNPASTVWVAVGDYI